MSTGEEDRIARSVALEKTYVHDVYDHMSALQYPEQRNLTPWPKVKKFLNDLEPGSIVCDVGCGNGKYLKVNPSVITIGSDRCRKLTQIAKEDENEVLLCDNLTLPFRDESFDAVLSIAVIHHFATKERRVGALRELARVLRIGGRLMITVWAMEQKDRKFESQDVLVQWHHPQFYRSPSLEFSTIATATSEEFTLPSRLAKSHISDETDSLFSRSNSLRHDGRPGKSRLRLFQSLRSIKTSPSSSSLSSPNETCYSFVKKALQKLSRSSKKEKHDSRAWFLESWASIGKDDHLPVTRYDPEGCEEDSSVKDLHIELRRMEKEGELLQFERSTASKNLLKVNLIQKSKSLNDIVSQLQAKLSVTESAAISRSQSSLVATAAVYKIHIISLETTDNESEILKPKLVKQKKSICEERIDIEIDPDEERDKATDMKRLVKELPKFKISLDKPEKYNVLKQKSLTEDIMSGERLKEKESVRQNIQKQSSLNEDLIYRRQKALDSLKDSFLMTSSKKFQMFRSGLTNKLKCSTTNIEKVTGASIKSGFAKILQGLTGSESIVPAEVSPPPQPHQGLCKSSSEDHSEDYPFERRCSHEENSDSSKDNSLQSDTSIDSEDSIISVIERVIPKGNISTSPTMLTTSGPHSPKMTISGVLSHPSSPKISQVMQYPNTKGKALSLPASPRNLVLSPSLKQAFKIPPVAQISSNANSSSVVTNIVTPNGKASGAASSILLCTDSNGVHCTVLPTEEEPVIKLSPITHIAAARLKAFGDKEMVLLSQKLSTLSIKETTEPRTADICEGNDDSHKLDVEVTGLAKDQEQSKKKDVQGKKKDTLGKSTFAVVKKLSNGLHSPNQSRLSSYELFNPETEDIDTDSSGVSTPDSVGSVISVKMESSNHSQIVDIPQSELASTSTQASFVDLKDAECFIQNLPHLATCLQSPVEDARLSRVRKSTKRHFSASSEEHSSDSDLRGSPALTRSSTTKRQDSSEKVDLSLNKKYPSLSKSPENEMWDKECRQYIVELAENLSERLLAEIDRYKEQNVSFEKELLAHPDTESLVDPYLSRLSEELSHVSKLTQELSEDLGPEVKTGEIESNNSLEEINEILLERDKNVLSLEEKTGGLCVRDDKVGVVSDPSTEEESPGSISGWLDSRRNTIESGYWKDHSSNASSEKGEEVQPNVITSCEIIRKLSTSDTQSHTRLSIESTDTIDVSDRAISSSEDSVCKRDLTQVEISSALSAESDYCDLDKSGDGSKSSTAVTTSSSSSGSRRKSEGIKCSSSQASLLRPGESIESSDAGDISDRTGSVSDFSRQNTESRSVITQSSASLASWSDCSKDIRFADRRTARCDGRSSSEETNPRAILTRQQAATQEPSENKIITDMSISGSTSQDSLTSESHGGSIMFHRYYHVFREGELDSLIDEFVENLHIISSYYDHTNWCIIAEKVRVWTI